MESNLQQWDKMSNVDKARHNAAEGVPYVVTYMLEQGDLAELSEAEQRKLVAQSYIQAANKRDKLVTKGVYHRAEFGDQRLAEAGATFSHKMRNQAVEILLNRDGKKLVDQIKDFSSKTS